MSYPPSPFAVDARPVKRLDVLFGQLAEWSGQRNAIDGQIATIALGS